MKIMIQTCADESAQKHYKNTIIKKHTISEIKANIDNIYHEELDQTDYEMFSIWGMKPIRGKSNHPQWNKLSIGDIVLFYANKTIISYGTVVSKFKNHLYAEKLWGKTNHDETWEYMYILKDIIHVEIPAKPILELARYRKTFFQGSVVFNEEISFMINELFDLYEGVTPFDYENVDFSEPVLNLLETDGSNTVSTRNEQTALRAYLFDKKKYKNCSICGKKYEKEFLATAHLKKRCLCNHEEKLDFNNVLPMCYFGCDVLYEKFYIGVKNGAVIKLRDSNVLQIQDRIAALDGLKCEYFSDDNEKYFDFHNDMVTHDNSER